MILQRYQWKKKKTTTKQPTKQKNKQKKSPHSSYIEENGLEQMEVQDFHLLQPEKLTEVSSLRFRLGSNYQNMTANGNQKDNQKLSVDLKGSLDDSNSRMRTQSSEQGILFTC